MLVNKRKKDDFSSFLNCGWGGRIRTYECRHQKPMPYHLATPQFLLVKLYVKQFFFKCKNFFWLLVKIDIFLLLTRCNGIIVSVLPKKIKEFFMSQAKLNPAFKENNIPVVFATDDKYLPYLAVTLASLKAHASPAYCYDLVVLCLGVSQKNKTLLSSMFEEVSNFSLRFVEMDDFFAGNSFFIDKYLSLSTYSRLFIAQIFARYQKVIYLDCDLLINADIREMFDIELEDKLLLCCRDFGFASGTIRKSPIFGDRYAETKLKIDNFLDYFNAGVLVFNVQAIRKQGIDKILLENVKHAHLPSNLVKSRERISLIQAKHALVTT